MREVFANAKSETREEVKLADVTRRPPPSAKCEPCPYTHPAAECSSCGHARHGHVEPCRTCHLDPRTCPRCAHLLATGGETREEVKLADVSRPRPVPGDGSTTHPCAMCPLDGETPEDCERCPVREEGASHPGRSGA